jgi:hypothetical protein
VITEAGPEEDFRDHGGCAGRFYTGESGCYCIARRVDPSDFVLVGLI